MNRILVGSSFLIILLGAMAAFGQAKPITQEEYKEAVQRAADMTEKAYPVAITIEEAKFRDSRQIHKGTFYVERLFRGQISNDNADGEGRKNH